MTRQQFIEQIAAYVKKYAPQYGIKVCSPIIAQAVLESGGGTSELATKANNFFGLKYRKGRCKTCIGVYTKTGSEQNPDGSYTSSVMQWCKFADMENGVIGYFDFINIPNYANLKGVTDPKTYLTNIKADGYATSLKYVDNVMAVISSYGLTKYDKKEETSTMAKLTPNVVYTMNGVQVSEKIIPDGTRWKNATNAKKNGFSVGSLYKKQQKLSGGTGRVQFVTVHNTNDLPNVYDDGEQYTRATYNENMNTSRVHFYIDDTGAWQNLKAGTGLCPNDPVGSAEVSWHSGDGSVATGGNMTSLSLEIIMMETPEHDLIAKDNGARIAAWLLWKHGLSINELVTHTYWVNKTAGKTFSDRDTQCCNPISGKKWCPSYIFNSNNPATAKKNWLAFKALVQGYLDALRGGSTGGSISTPPSPQKPPVGPQEGAVTPYRVRVSIPDLYIRSEPDKYSQNKGFIKPGVYTIVAESSGTGATKWGKLKSGMGWISLDYAKKV